MLNHHKNIVAKRLGCAEQPFIVRLAQGEIVQGIA